MATSVRSLAIGAVAGSNSGSGAGAGAGASAAASPTPTAAGGLSRETVAQATDQLFAHCMSGDAVRVGKALAAGGKVTATERLTDFTPLHKAAQWRRAAVVEVLAANGANVNSKTSIGHTPLHVAAYRAPKDVVGDDPEAAKALLAVGADPNIQDNVGGTPLMRAIVVGNTKIAVFLSTHPKVDILAMGKHKGKPVTAEKLAAETGNSVVEALLRSQRELRLVKLRAKLTKGDLALPQSPLPSPSKVRPATTKGADDRTYEDWQSAAVAALWAEADEDADADDSVGFPVAAPVPDPPAERDCWGEVSAACTIQ